ncbi:MAG: ACT domain-containing protein, partial [Myxococcota bacterium]
LGFRVKLLAVGRLNGSREVEARVHPAFVRRGTPLSAIPGALNAVQVDSRNLGSTLYQGPGAGGFPTGNAVLADIIEAARGLRAGVMPPAPPRGTLVLADPDASLGAYYLRFLVADRPGVLASIAQALAENGISLETVLQPSAVGPGPVPVVVTTHACTRGDMVGALAALRKVRRSVKAVTAVRIELE